MKIHGTAKGGALSKKDFGVAFGGGALSVELCQENGGDTVGINPETPYNKFGYRMNAGFAAIDKTISSVVFYLNEGSGATGNISAYVGVEGSATKMGTVDVETIGAATSGGNPITFDDDTHEVSENDVFWFENDEGRENNANAYWVGNAPPVTTSPLDNTTVMFGGSGDWDAGVPPPVDTINGKNYLIAVKVCITYS